MSRAAFLILIGALAFAAILILRLPASWFAPGAKSAVGCAEAQGTLWSGTCSGLVAQGRPLGELSWQLHPLRLFVAQIDADIVLGGPTMSIRGHIDRGFGRRLEARGVHADIPLDSALIPQIPPNLQGRLHADLAFVSLRGAVVTALDGTVEARDLRQRGPDGDEPLGSYAIAFLPSPGVPTGQLRDIGGPLEVQGALRLTPEPGFDLEGMVKARPDAAPDLARELQYLGSPDADGRRPFSLAGTF